MVKKVLLVFAICFLCFGSGQTTTKKKKNVTREPIIPTYLELFRDHVYYTLSDKGKEIFHASSKR